jgi:hypothetical protein
VSTADARAGLAALMARQLKQTAGEVPDYEARVEGLRAYHARLVRQYQEVIESEFTAADVRDRARAGLTAFLGRNP